MKIIAILFFLSTLYALPKAEMYIQWDNVSNFEEFGQNHIYGKLRKLFLEKGVELLGIGDGAFDPSHFSKKETSYLIFWGMGERAEKFNFKKFFQGKVVLFIWEPPTNAKKLYNRKFHKKFYKIFTFDDDLVDNKKYIKFYYPSLQPKIKQEIPFHKKKFCVMVNSRRSSDNKDELYSEREKVVSFFEKNAPEEFDLFGRFWEMRICYRGLAKDKIETIKNYKYCICYENTKNIKGYITEKIFDCFAAGCVPIYLGASNIEEYIPREAFVDRRQFTDDAALYRHLKKLSEGDYQRYLQAADEFIHSNKARFFTYEHLLKTMGELL